MSAQVTYKTHILVGVRESGSIAVIADWPHVPKQAEVLEKIRQTRDGYATFALCTPTSIMPAGELAVTPAGAICRAAVFKAELLNNHRAVVCRGPTSKLARTS